MRNREVKGALLPGDTRPGDTRPGPTQAVWGSGQRVRLLTAPLTTGRISSLTAVLTEPGKKTLFGFFFPSFKLWGSGYTSRGGGAAGGWRWLGAGTGVPQQAPQLLPHTHTRAGPLPPLPACSPGTRSPLNSWSRSWLRLEGLRVSFGWGSANERLRVPVLMQCLKLPSACRSPRDAGRFFWRSREGRLLRSALTQYIQLIKLQGCK